MSGSPTKPDLIPKRFETERLVIRAPRRGDGAAVCEAVLETLEELRPWMPWAQGEPTAAESEAIARRAARAYREGRDLRLQLYLKATGEFVGSSGLHRINWSVPRFEIGYWCRKRFQGQGYITEAVRGIAGFAFEALGAQRVEIRFDSRNERSRGVAERAGFIFEGVLRNNERALDGGLRDTVVYSLTRDDWPSLERAGRASEE